MKRKVVEVRGPTFRLKRVEFGTRKNMQNAEFKVCAKELNGKHCLQAVN